MQAASNTSDTRSSPRSNVFLMAAVCAGAASYPVKVRNLSARGALLEGPQLPENGTTIRLRRGSLQATGEIAWRSATQCGIQFDSPIQVDEWVRRTGPQGQQAVDHAIAHVRDGSPLGRAGPLLSGRTRADLLESTSDELLRICERIAAMPGLSTDLAEELVKLDALAHSLKNGR